MKPPRNPFAISPIRPDWHRLQSPFDLAGFHKHGIQALANLDATVATQARPPEHDLDTVASIRVAAFVASLGYPTGFSRCFRPEMHGGCRHVSLCLSTRLRTRRRQSRVRAAIPGRTPEMTDLATQPPVAPSSTAPFCPETSFRTEARSPNPVPLVGRRRDRIRRQLHRHRHRHRHPTALLHCEQGILFLCVRIVANTDRAADGFYRLNKSLVRAVMRQKGNRDDTRIAEAAKAVSKTDLRFNFMGEDRSFDSYRTPSIVGRAANRKRGCG